MVGVGRYTTDQRLPAQGRRNDVIAGYPPRVSMMFGCYEGLVQLNSDGMKHLAVERGRPFRAIDSLLPERAVCSE